MSAPSRCRWTAQANGVSSVATLDVEASVSDRLLWRGSEGPSGGASAKGGPCRRSAEGLFGKCMKMLRSHAIVTCSIGQVSSIHFKQLTAPASVTKGQDDKRDRAADSICSYIVYRSTVQKDTGGYSTSGRHESR